MHYIKRVLFYIHSVQSLFHTKKIGGFYLLVQWFFGYLLFELANQIYSLSGAGQPLLDDLFLVDIFFFGGGCLFLITFYYYFLVAVSTFEFFTARET